MNNYKRIGAIAFFVLNIAQADAQQIHQALASGGGNASGVNGTVSYTIGQAFYTTTSGSSGTLAAGIQTTLNLSTPLPIELVSFEGECTGGKVHLNWQTAIELNNDFFVIEKSNDASQWAAMATIKGGQASKSYFYMDEYPSIPASYYRLKQVDQDGAFSYSPVIHILGCTDKTKAISLYPNPTATGVYLAMEEKEHMEYGVYNIKGSLLRKGKIQNATTYIDMSIWAAGTYFLKLWQNNTIINSFSIIKN